MSQENVPLAPTEGTQTEFLALPSHSCSWEVVGIWGENQPTGVLLLSVSSCLSVLAHRLRAHRLSSPRRQGDTQALVAGRARDLSRG